MKHAQLMVPSWFIKQKMAEYTKKIERSFAVETSNEYKQAIAHKYFALSDLLNDWEFEVMKGGEKDE